MNTDHATPTTIDEYIATFSPEVASILAKIRAVIRKEAPDAEEKISYQMPAFFHNGALVYFGAFKQHIGFYPPIRNEELKRETAMYAGGKGNLRFPLDQPVPYTLIRKIVQVRVRENQLAHDAKSRKKQLA